MVERKEKFPKPEGKFVLITHEKGTDRYILANLNGNLIECDEEELSQQYRYHEVLVSFETLKKNLWAKGRAMEKPHFLRPDRVVNYVNQSVNDIIKGAVEMLGSPPKERIEFFSVPKRIVSRFDWIPRKR